MGTSWWSCSLQPDRRAYRVHGVLTTARAANLTLGAALDPIGSVPDFEVRKASELDIRAGQEASLHYGFVEGAYDGKADLRGTYTLFWLKLRGHPPVIHEFEVGDRKVFIFVELLGANQVRRWTYSREQGADSLDAAVRLFLADVATKRRPPGPAPGDPS